MVYDDNNDLDGGATAALSFIRTYSKGGEDGYLPICRRERAGKEGL